MDQRVMYLSVEELWRLSNACRPIEDAFGGHNVWIVGSCLDRANYRDVDLRVILPDDEYTKMFHATKYGVDGMSTGLFDQFLMLIQTSISAMLRETTRLPIDFQVQSQTESNQYNGKRNPVCLRPYIGHDFKPQWMGSLKAHRGRLYHTS